MDISRHDQLVLDVAHEEGWGCPCDVVVADDPTGALTAAALDLLAEHDGSRLAFLSRDRVQADATVAAAEARGLRERVHVAGVDGPLEATEFLTSLEGLSVHVALTRLPKALAELDLIAGAVAAAAVGSGSGATFVGGGNTKHMTHTQNDVLARSFEEVRASRGKGKFRCLVAQGPRPAADATSTGPDSAGPGVVVEQSDLGPVHGVGGVFGGAKVDRGGRILLDAAVGHLRSLPDSPVVLGAAATLLDLGCGNGSVTLGLGREFPEARLVASDLEADAVVSARRTLAPLGERAQVRWEDAAAGVPDGSVDVVLLNPPFHEGTRTDATLVEHLLDAAHRVLRPGGHLYLVHNSHLRYRFEVERRFADVDQVARDPKFTVLHAHA